MISSSLPKKKILLCAIFLSCLFHFVFLFSLYHYPLKSDKKAAFVRKPLIKKDTHFQKKQVLEKFFNQDVLSPAINSNEISAIHLSNDMSPFESYPIHLFREGDDKEITVSNEITFSNSIYSLDFLKKSFSLEKALKGVKKLPPLSAIPKQARFLKPKHLKVDYPIPPEEDKSDKAIVGFGFLTCHILEQKDLLGLSIVEIILMDTDASPLKHAFLKSKACKQATISMDVDFTEVPVVITLKGCYEKDADLLEEVLKSTLKEVVEKGIPAEMIENAIHQLELAKSEVTGNHFPYGLSLFMRSALLKQHGGNPENGLMIHSLFDSLRVTLQENPSYLIDLIKKYFLENSHFVRLVMVPNENLSKIEHDEEKEALEKIKKELNVAQIKHIVEKSKELDAFQKKSESETLDDILPKLALSDVPVKGREYELKKEDLSALTTYHHDTFTNGLIYADLTFSMPFIAEKDLSLLRFLTILLPQLGCSGRNYVENLHYLQAHTGGVGVVLSFNTQVNDYNAFFPSLSIRGKALEKKAYRFFPILKELVTEVDFKEKGRIKEILLKHYTSLYSTLQQSPLKYAMNLSAAGLDLPSMVANQWFGLDYFLFIQELTIKFDDICDEIIEKLVHLYQQIFASQPDLILSCSAEEVQELKKNHFYELDQLYKRPFQKWSPNYALKSISSQGKVIASNVAFISKTIKTIPYNHEDTPYLTLAANLFDNTTLHAKIREQGGAYGGGAIINTLSGNFTFYSYRDPNISKSLDAFSEAVVNIVKGDFEESDIEEAKLEVIQGMDAPVAPGSRADLSYSRLKEGKTESLRQKFREQLLKASKEDIMRAVSTHIVPQMDKGPTIAFASKELLEKENKWMKQPLIIENL
jgi:Zn-dependent M16 (insulinase) family peptidase